MASVHDRYTWPETYRFRHVYKGETFQVIEETATEAVPAGYYVRASKRKAIPCAYCEWSNSPHISADAGVVYVPAALPVKQLQVWGPY